MYLFKALSAGISAFLYWSLIIFPTITEIIIVTQQTKDQIPYTLLICGSIQTGLSIVGAILMGCCCRNDCEDIWCSSPKSFPSMLRGGYTVYCLSPWIITNMIISWIFISQVNIVWYIQLLIYSPIVIYGPFVAASWATLGVINP